MPASTTGAGLRAIADRHAHMVTTNDLDGIDELFSPDVIAKAPGAGEMQGRPAFKAFVHLFAQAAPNAVLDITSSVESEDTIVVEGTFAGTQTGPLVGPSGEIPPTGKKFVIEWAGVFEIHDGSITHHRIYFDQLDFLGQLGLIPGA